MKLATLISLVALVSVGAETALVSEANAVVCARGVYRAGCVGPHGRAVVARRPVYRPYHHGVVVHRRVY